MPGKGFNRIQLTESEELFSHRLSPFERGYHSKVDDAPLWQLFRVAYARLLHSFCYS